MMMRGCICTGVVIKESREGQAMEDEVVLQQSRSANDSLYLFLSVSGCAKDEVPAESAGTVMPVQECHGSDTGSTPSVVSSCEVGKQISAGHS